MNVIGLTSNENFSIPLINTLRFLYRKKKKRILENLYKNPDISILRQDKGRGVVIMNKQDYVNKAERFLNGPEFERLSEDPTNSFQILVQKTLLKMKKNFSQSEYKKLYPSSSRPGFFLA